MGLVYKEYLDEEKNRIFSCQRCKTHLSTFDSIISTAFVGVHGKAYLFDHVVNIFTCDPQERRMTTGLHLVEDVKCTACSAVIGWKYLKAYEPSQKYKEGRFILEKELICEN